MTNVMDVPASEPLSREHHAQFEAAHARAKVFRKAAAVAAFNGWVSGALAAAAAPFALGGGLELCIVLGMAWVAFQEFRGRRMLLQLEPRAGTILGWNQVALLAMIVGYCLWMLYGSLTGPSEIDKQIQTHPELATVLGSTDELNAIYRWCVVGIYGATVIFSCVFQGLNALYYFRCGRKLALHVAETPAWILELQRTSST